MAKSSFTLPVSRQAYQRFTERINHVFTDAGNRAAALAALGLYLRGERENYAAELTPECAMAFEMLRYDIDLAIARSTAARKRAMKRNASAPKSTKAKTKAPSPTPKAGNGDDSDPAKALLDKMLEVLSKPHRPIRFDDEGNLIDAEPDAADIGEDTVIPKSRRARRAEQKTRHKNRWRKIG